MPDNYKDLTIWKKIRNIQGVVDSAQVPDPLDPQNFGFLDPDPRGKISTKNCPKKNLLLKPKSELLKKRDYNLVSEWFVKVQHKKAKKNETKNQKICNVKKCSKF